MPYFVNKTFIIACFKNHVFHSHVFAGKSNMVRSEQALFANISLNWGDLTTPRLYLPAWFLKQDPRGVTYFSLPFPGPGKPWQVPPEVISREKNGLLSGIYTSFLASSAGMATMVSISKKCDLRMDNCIASFSFGASIIATASYLPSVQSILRYLIPFFDSSSIIFKFSEIKSLGFVLNFTSAMKRIPHILFPPIGVMGCFGIVQILFISSREL
jgi:hypothetical protein